MQVPRPAQVLLALARLALIVYDILSWPAYFVLERPDVRARRARRTRAERVDANTWMRCFNTHTDPVDVATKRARHLGTTMADIFANAVHAHSSRPCLGYRAVVTCAGLFKPTGPSGKMSSQDTSFRSDYTWYTYEQIGYRVHDIASGLYRRVRMRSATRALFAASSGVEWFCVAHACYQLGAQLVLAPDLALAAAASASHAPPSSSAINNNTSSARTLAAIMREARVEIAVSSCERLGELCDALEQLDQTTQQQQQQDSECNLRAVVIIDWQFTIDYDEPIFARLRDAVAKLAAHVDLVPLGHVEELGVEHPVEMTCTRFVSHTDACEQLACKQVGADARNLKLCGESRISASYACLMQQAEVSASRAACNIDWKSMRELRFSSCSMRGVEAQQPRALDRRSSMVGIGTATSDAPTKPSMDKAQKPQPNDLAMIVYTYGALGQARPVQLTHAYLAKSNGYLFLDGLIGADDVHCTTLPLDCVIEFMTEMCVFAAGGAIGYSCDPHTLFYDGKHLFRKDRSDLEALEPTFLLARPYMLERLRASVQQYIHSRLSRIVSFALVNLIYDYKRRCARHYLGTPIIDRLFCARVRRLFGTNMRRVLCVGATDCTETKDYFACMLNLPVTELYGPDEASVSLMSLDDIWDYRSAQRQDNDERFGDEIAGDDDEEDEQTESTGLLMHRRLCVRVPQKRLKKSDSKASVKSIDHEEDMSGVQLMPRLSDTNVFSADTSRNLLRTPSTLLCPTFGTRVRLEDWDDFRCTDSPYPRGRLVLGGEALCSGYYARAQLTRASFAVDESCRSLSWFRTQDIARAFPNGSFEIISALSDMIKMCDGQFLSLSQIEHLLRNSQFVDNVCALCADERAFVIALVVPNLRRLALKSPGEANLKTAIGPEPEPAELTDIEFRREVCNDRLLCEFVASHLHKLIVSAGLMHKGSALSIRFHLVPEIWTPESELVSPSFEPRRAAIQKFYAPDIQSIVRLELTPSGRRRAGSLGLASNKSAMHKRRNNLVVMGNYYAKQ